MNLGTIKDKTGASILRKKAVKKAVAAASVCCVAVIAISGAISLTNNSKTEIPTLEAPITSNSQGSVTVTPDGNIADVILPNATPDNEDASANTTVGAKMLLPVTGGNVLKGYAQDMLVYSSTLKHWSTHPALDIAANEGSTVLSALDGTVESVVNDELMGLVVTIAHADNYKTVYASLASVPDNIKEGASVLRGQAIGSVGTSAASEAEDGAHLHFEVYCNGKTVNPQTYLSDFLK